LLKRKVFSQRDLEALDADAKTQVEDAVQHAEAAPYPDVAEAAYPVYVEDIRHG
jgi:TPP-dependent pyruvate/acetoin dehydrogenase alpha subunit